MKYFQNLIPIRHFIFVWLTQCDDLLPVFLSSLLRDHAKQLLEKYIGKPFFNYVADQRQRMTVEDLELGVAWLQGHFHVIKHIKDDAPTVDWVLEVARLAVMRLVV